MIIQCNHCSARFRMDDAKLANGAVKVRCAKCKEVFVVEKPEEPISVPEPAVTSEAAASAHAPEFSFDLPVTAPAPSAAPSEQHDADAFSFDQEMPPPVNAATPPAAADEFDWQVSAAGESQGFDSASPGESFTAQQSPAASAKETTSDNEFDFGEVDFSSVPAPEAETPDAAASRSASLDFGDISFSDQPETATAEQFATAEDQSVEPSVASATSDFMFSFDTDAADKTPVAGEKAVATEPAGGSGDFGDFSFGETSAAVAVSDHGDDKAAVAQFDDFAATFPGSISAEDELPPSSLTSRKKGGSLFPIFVICGAIVLIVATAGAGVYFFGGPQAFSKIGLGFIVDWYGDKKAEEGGVALRNVTASYVVNSTAGDLFVVRGEVVNNFKSPRASIQVKVNVLGQGGAVLLSKSAFCGNLLTNEQLATLPQAKLDETMNNQFGDSLANIGLKPGASIAFVVALGGVPKEAVDYTVQVSGSTVAAQQ